MDYSEYIKQLRQAKSRPEAYETINDLTVRQLFELAEKVGAVLNPEYRKEDLRSSLVQQVVGFRLNSEAIINGAK